MWGTVAPGSSAAVDPVLELKAWARRAWWAKHATPRQKARAVVALTAAPWRFAREAFRVVPHHAPFVTRHFAVPIALQVAHLVWLRLRHGLDPTSYYRFQLFRPERRRNASRYVQTADTGRVLRWLVAHTPGYGRAFGDKRAFEAWCHEHDLPTVRTLIEFDAGRPRWRSGERLPAADLFSKPANSQGGEGATRWTYAKGRYVSADGRSFDEAGLIAELSRLSADEQRPLLLQPALRNSRRDAALTPGGLCTARMTTMKLPSGDPQLLYAAYRMPAEAMAAADNFATGGLSSPIDVASGRLLPSVRKDVSLQVAPVHSHPRTGGQIAGHQLPHWAEAVNLVVRAHGAVDWKGVPVIGWDVALLEDGPVLVEGNNVPCSTLAQMVLDRPLGNLPLVACLNAHLRERFAPSATRV